jgi:hypothetical protein
MAPSLATVFAIVEQSPMQKFEKIFAFSMYAFAALDFYPGIAIPFANGRMHADANGL